MIGFEEARRTILAAATPGPELRVGLGDSLGRFLAEPLRARIDSPRFDNSAVDGYGVRVENIAERRIVGRSEAGDPFAGTIGAGEAVRILTGAAVPPGMEAVAMQEDAEVAGDRLVLTEEPRPGQNIRVRGEEYAAGATLVDRGTLSTPSVIGLAAANGLAELTVGAIPMVAVLVTGNELAAPGETLRDGMIYESNGPGLAAALRAMGVGCETRTVADDPATLRTAMADALDRADVLVTTGGASVGDRDYVRACATEIGVEERFWRIRMKPGKPVYFGTRGGTLVFGLPGNPVSALVTFHLLVRPALVKLMGGDPDLRTLPAALAAPLRKREGRAEFVRARLWRERDRLVVEPTKGQGSHMVGGLASAEALIHLPEGSHDLAPGAIVDVSLLPWGLL